MYLCMTVTAVALEYAWSLLYYRALYQSGKLIAVKELQSVDIPAALLQHFLVNIPVLCMTVSAALVWKRQITTLFGLTTVDKKRRYSVLLAGGAFVILLAAALVKEVNTPANLLYQWSYYLIFVALAEETLCRGLLPLLMEKGEFPEWCVWVVPGVLFGLMHTLIPAVRGTLTAAIVFSSIGGMLFSHCALYSLRRWSGTLWLPVLLHAAWDFTGVFIG